MMNSLISLLKVQIQKVWLNFTFPKQQKPIERTEEKVLPKAGLNLGAMVMGDDFDQPLPDEFWWQ